MIAFLTTLALVFLEVNPLFLGSLHIGIGVKRAEGHNCYLSGFGLIALCFERPSLLLVNVSSTVKWRTAWYSEITV